MSLSKTIDIKLSDSLTATLPLVKSGDIWIYSFDLLGKAKYNRAAAETLAGLIRAAEIDFDIFLTAETKSIGLVDNLARHFEHDDYVILRKSVKGYMINPASIEVTSITTAGVQRLHLGEENFHLLRNRRVCIVDDVISTGGTLEAFYKMAGIIGFEIVLIACALTEGHPRTEYRNTPLLSIANIPLPGGW
ncbi:MAG: adenine phosphoribosyltransferase [Defluviitaleaceae bacterium]|nr:adenine phosphoribosyltransferase [Defluviitaleaceae bacterium]